MLECTTSIIIQLSCGSMCMIKQHYHCHNNYCILIQNLLIDVLMSRYSIKKKRNQNKQRRSANHSLLEVKEGKKIAAII